MLCAAGVSAAFPSSVAAEPTAFVSPVGGCGACSSRAGSPEHRATLDELNESLQNTDRRRATDICCARKGCPPPAGRGDGGRLGRETTEILESELVLGDVLILLGAGDMNRLRPFLG